ncbi:HAD family hydrolase [Helicobacter sp. MIT 00-7814]|uniref:HAD family hydrolase n=1 Tax=unclassified Helicobacter TaxID=2593540 RepID=UPI000E1EC848|nr:MULTISPECIES: HAD family hydrolase [unclassified Helicobacter]RDU52611.1 HAD family hydrolase [Helicobacter sp. MIT 00-7814]RDU55931.1 HAD family hydrolase [Helicobacter sp. MIT 99-10781]
MNKEAVILFDLDGTLIDSTPAIVESFLHAYKVHNAPPPKREGIIQSIGHTLNSMFAQNGVKSEEVESYVSAYRECYRARMEEGTTLLEGAREAILQAHSFATLGVVTTKRGDFSAKLLESFGVLEYFAIVLGIEQVEKPKPDSEPILKALEYIKASLGREIARKNCFMVGDTILDLQAAKNAKINGIGVLCGYGSKQSLETFNTPLCKNALEAVAFVKNLVKN